MSPTPLSSRLLIALLASCSVMCAVPAHRDKMTASGTMEIEEAKRSSLANVLLAILDWASPEGDPEETTSEDSELQYRPQRSMYSPGMMRDKNMCKNFFWKTFSAC